jgi:hypothetical protein
VGVHTGSKMNSQKICSDDAGGNLGEDHHVGCFILFGKS